ncbi:MAG: aldehyde dehydrogenase EutE [Clostridiaceae bacterium]|nr:aldehyde dehydrogenase EutE [Clostridiaceae bacterium]
MSLSEQQINQIVIDTIRSMRKDSEQKESEKLTSDFMRLELEPVIEEKSNWLCNTIDEAVASAKAGQRILSEMTLDQRDKLIYSMRRAAMDNVRYLSELAYNETGYGSIEHKIQKNTLAIEKTPGIEDLSATAITGDFGLTMVELAPYGVIGAITPSTNPTSTIINNSISMIAAGNSVVYNSHPGANKCSVETMRVLNEAIVAAGGPATLICSVKQPTAESGQELMDHKDVALLTVTGGEGIVKVAMRSGKKVIAAGPGNPPVIVDDTAILNQAARDIVDGASFENNILCVAEKEVFVYDNVADRLMSEMENNGAYKISDDDIDKIVRTVLIQKNGDYYSNKNYIGKPAGFILRESGVSFSADPRLIIAEVDEDHPFVKVEMLMPVLAIVRVKDNNIRTAVKMALKAEADCKHSAVIHSQDVSNLSLAARVLNTSIFVKNAPSYAGLGFGGEGFTTLSIATPTGEGLTSARSFTRQRRCVMYGNFRIV